PRCPHGRNHFSQKYKLQPGVGASCPGIYQLFGCAERGERYLVMRAVNAARFLLGAMYCFSTHVYVLSSPARSGRAGSQFRYFLMSALSLLRPTAPLGASRT